MKRKGHKYVKPEDLPLRPHYMSAYDAADIRDTKCIAQIKTLDELIQMGERKIKYASTLGLNDITWIVPKFGMENPWYNLKRIIASLIYHFRRQRYWVRQIRPGVLYISWRWVSVLD